MIRDSNIFYLMGFFLSCHIYVLDFFFFSCCHRYFPLLFIVHGIFHPRDFPAPIIVLYIALRLFYAFVRDIFHHIYIILFNSSVQNNVCSYFIRSPLDQVERWLGQKFSVSSDANFGIYAANDVNSMLTFISMVDCFILVLPTNIVRVPHQDQLKVDLE